MALAQRRSTDKASNGDAWDGIWRSYESFEGELPPEYKKLLGYGKSQMIGRPRDIFRRYGRTEEERQYYAYLPGSKATHIPNDLVCIPKGASACAFLLGQWIAQDLLPPRYEQTESFIASAYPAIPYTIPRHVTTTPTRFDIRDLAPTARSCSTSADGKETILAFKKEWEAPYKLARKLRTRLRDAGLLSSTCYFQGTSLRNLESVLRYFAPAYPSQSCAEMGPGIYATKKLSTAAQQAGETGAIMIFKDVALEELSVWSPGDEDWEALLKNSLGYGESGTLPAEFHAADVIVGPVCANISDFYGSTTTPIKSDEEQTVFCSEKSAALLRSSLCGIIYLTTDELDEQEKADKKAHTKAVHNSEPSGMKPTTGSASKGKGRRTKRN
ncbi:hypothetical protein BJ508DRAFT_374326 [Ascobolus immersus RN42]|uniref:Uncharacterized protein n=1 Tax=Ascobolus immersus RN42 TaxID=1160509 RepID=A0A3N4IDX1_ASCIM|nr:hypothetical protein BJ508DRAFT_374326 [Ascobolus immersus RN42]